MTNTKEAVGYKKPPRKSQFRPGVSGNANGRPRGSLNTYKLLDDILKQKVTIIQNGHPVKISKKMAILIQSINEAVKGDLRAIKDIFPHILASDAKNEERAQEEAVLNRDDQAILATFIKSIKEGEHSDEQFCTSNTTQPTE